MNKQLLKYQIGLGVIGLFTLIMLVVVVSQAAKVKHDTQTYDKATKIAADINAYVDRRGAVPSSLRSIGINDVPEEVTYKKLSGSRYEFCVEYKAAGESYGNGYASRVFGDWTGGSYSRSSYLYIQSSHHKGQNCQTVKIYSYFDDYPINANYDTKSF